MRRILFASSVIALSCAVISKPAHAAGFYLQEQSVSGLGSAFAGQAAMPRDASIIFFNPAGMTYLEGTQGNIGVHTIRPYVDIDDTGTVNSTPGGFGQEDGNPYGLEPVPNLYVSHQVNDKLWAGFGVAAPFGLASDYDDNWFGRFDATETELTTIDLQPSIAYKANDWLSLGGSLIFQYAHARLENRIYAGAGAEGNAKLEGDDTSLGFNIGVIAEPRPDTRIGLDYRSNVEHTLDGELKIRNTGVADATIPGTVLLDLPDIATLSVAHDLNDKWTLLGSASWFGWNSFDQIEVIRKSDGGSQSNTRQEYQNTMAFSVGAEYKHNNDWTFRAGYQFDETPTQDGFRTSRTPDGDRNWFAAGATYSMNDRLSLDLAATYIDVASEEISLTRNPDSSSSISADTNGNVGIVSVGLNYKF